MGWVSKSPFRFQMSLVAVKRIIEGGKVMALPRAHSHPWFRGMTDVVTCRKASEGRKYRWHGEPRLSEETAEWVSSVRRHVFCLYFYLCFVFFAS